MISLFIILWLTPIIWFIIEYIIIDFFKGTFSFKNLLHYETLLICIPIFGFVLMFWCVIDDWNNS